MFVDQTASQIHFNYSRKKRGPKFFEIDLQLTKKSLRLVNVKKILKKIFLKF